MAGLYNLQQQVLNGFKPGEMVIISAGRRMGKSHVNDLLKQFYTKMYPPKISWRELPGNKIQAYIDPTDTTTFVMGLRDHDMEQVHRWCNETKCATRLSFDTFQLKSAKHRTLFLLKWST